MEVCGGHTHTIYRHGLEDLLPPEVELVHGPGCPVCVIPMGRVDDAIALAEETASRSRPSATCCACPAGAARCSRRRRAAPTCAWSTRRSTRWRSPRASPSAASSSSRSASRRRRPRPRSRCCAPAPQGTPNFAVFCNHVVIEPPLRAMLETPGLRVDAFIGPGHVSTVIGTDALPLHPGGVRPPDRRLGVRAGRPAAVDRDAAAPARRGPLRGREPVHARRAARGQRTRARGDRRDDGAARGLRVARPRHAAAERAAAAARVRRRGTRSSCTRCRARASRTRRRAGAARC